MFNINVNSLVLHSGTIEYKGLCTFKGSYVIQRGVSTKDPPRLGLGLSRSPPVLVSPGPGLVAQSTGWFWDKLFSGIEDMHC